MLPAEGRRGLKLETPGQLDAAVDVAISNFNFFSAAGEVRQQR